MRKKLLLCGMLLYTAHAAPSQTAKIDSLGATITKLHGNSKVLALNDLTRLLMESNLKAAEINALKTFSTAKALGNWKGMAMSLEYLGDILVKKADLIGALDAYQQSLEIRQQVNDNTGQAQVMYQLSKLFLRFDSADEAIRTLLGALSIWEKSDNPSGAAQAQELLGEAFEAKQDFQTAALHYKAANDLWLYLIDLKKSALSAAKIGAVYRKMGLESKALSFYTQALELAGQLEDKPLAAPIHQAVAAIYVENRDFSNAELHNRLANDSTFQAIDHLALANNILIAGIIAANRGEDSNSRKKLSEVSSLIEPFNTTAGVPALYAQIATVYAWLGDKSLSRKNEELATKAMLAVTEKELRSKQHTLKSLLVHRSSVGDQQLKMELLQIENTNNKRVRSFLFVLMGLSGFLAAIVYLFYRKKQIDNQLLTKRNEEILNHKAEMDEMNKELEMKNISLEMLNKKLVDEIAERENIERSSFARDRFLATMSHEMRTPLNIITGLTHLLLENKPRADQSEQLRALQFAANELIVFINDVLDFSKIEAGKIDLQNREFDFVDTSNDVLNDFVGKAEEKGLLFYCTLDSQIPRKLMGDNARFYQILTNLLNNCLENTDEGMIRAEVFLEEQKGKNIVVKIVVEGTDGGKERNLMPIGFQPFDNDLNFEHVEGNLLSLAITKRLIELQHGRLQIENIYGEATKFTVLLPFKVASNLKQNIVHLDMTDHSYLQGNSILLVEDNKINQLVVAKMLTRCGMVVVTADNGFEALEKIEAQDFDLVLMDIQMPGMDGYRATAEIRQLPSPEKNAVPIIALTSSAFLTEKEKAVLFGMNDHVGKPFSPEELLEKIAACLAVRKDS